MLTETEIKLRWPEERGNPRDAIERLGYQETLPRVLELNQLFDRASGELKSSDRLLRLRQTGNQALVTYKGPANRTRHKIREEIEFNVSDSEHFRLVLDRLGFAPGFRYEKFRTTFQKAGEEGLVTVDETPIGTFLELEGAESWIDDTAKHLGFADGDYITASYAALYREFRRVTPMAPADMLFSK